MKNIHILLAIVILFSVKNSFSQLKETYTDTRDGKTYKTVKIGAQTWMAENFAYKADSGCYAYDNKQSNVAIYGYLYSWKTAKKICPKGWHMPSESDWNVLIKYLGGEKVAGGKMKEIETAHWKSPNKGATNESGFTALPGSNISYNGIFVGLGSYAYWWSSTFPTLGPAYYFLLFDSSPEIMKNFHYTNTGLSVRYLKD